MVEADWEISCHGYRWIDHHGMPEETEEREHIRMSIETQTRVAGSRPLGHFLGRRSENTVRLIAEESGFVYSARTPMRTSCRTGLWSRGIRLLMLPYTADVNDHRFATTPGFDWGEPFFAYARDAFDALYEEGDPRPRG